MGVKMGHSKIGVSDDAERQNVTNCYSMPFLGSVFLLLRGSMPVPLVFAPPVHLGGSWLLQRGLEGGQTHL